MTAGTATQPRGGVETDVRVRAGRLPRSPIFYGIVVALLAAAAGEWLDIAPPAAYGICYIAAVLIVSSLLFARREL